MAYCLCVTTMAATQTKFTNSWFSLDITKIQTKKLQLLLSFYFHVVLQQLKTFTQTSFRFRKVLCFVTRHLADARKAVILVKNITDFGRFCYLNILCLRKNITLIFMSSSNNEFTHQQENSKTDVSVGFRRPYMCLSKGHKHGISIQSLINLGKTFFGISCIRNIAQT